MAMTVLCNNVVQAGNPALQMKFLAWPMLDRAAWEAAAEEKDILLADNRAARWSAGTRRSVIKAYGRWLAWLAQENLLEESELPIARATPSRVTAYVNHLRGTVGSTGVWSYVQSLGMALAAMASESDLDWLWKISRRLAQVASPTKAKRDRIVPARDLTALGLRLMTEAEVDLHGKVCEIAARYRNGLMIALLAARPVRMRNLQSISLGAQLRRRTNGYSLHFGAEETKNVRELYLVLPAELSERLETYLVKWRPVLLSQRKATLDLRQHEDVENALWISIFGRPMSVPGIYERITEVTRQQFGRSVNPHLFRDCAATSIALEDPDHVRITVSILGHACLSTSERYYNHALSQKAASLHQAELIAMRRQRRRPRKR